MNLSIGGDLAPSLGETGKKFADQEGFLGNKFPFSRPKFLMTLFKISDHDFRIFPIFHIFAACNVVFDPFFTGKTPISENNSFKTPFLLCLCFRTHPTNTTSQNIGGRMHGPSPHLKFGGGVPKSPLGLRP